MVRLVPALAALSAVVLGAAPSAQPPPCGDLLDQAEARYALEVYLDVEPLVTRCVSAPSTEIADVERGLRLLALSYLKQGIETQAREAIASLLDRSPAYAADRFRDLPTYVNLVASVRRQRRAGPGAPGLLDINTATVREISALSGMTPAIAAQIIAFRIEFGPFRFLDELGLVPGVGRDQLQRLATQVAVE